MALTDFFSNLQLLIRWLHVMAGIVWIGHLYFFNFVNIPFQGTIGGDVKKVVNPQLLTRALWWFRWGAMITFLAGSFSSSPRTCMRPASASGSPSYS